MLNPPQAARPLVALFARYGRPEPGIALLLTASLLAGAGLSLAAPQALRAFIDLISRAGSRAPVDRLWDLAGLFLVATLSAQAARLVSSYAGQRLGWSATNRLRHDLARSSLDLDLGFLHAQPPGEMIERIDGDASELAGLFSQTLLQLVGATLMIGGVIVVLLVEEWRVGLVLGGLSLAALAVLIVTRKLAVGPAANARQSRSELAGFLEERIGGLDDIRANAGGRYVMRRLSVITDRLFERTLRSAQVGRAVWVMSAAMFAVSSLAALVLGVWLFERSEATLGKVYLFVQYAAMMREPFYLIGAHMQDVQRAGGSLQRISDLMSLRPTMRDGSETDWLHGPPSVKFEGVRFAYAATPILKGIDFQVGPGEMLGVVGRTGSGKTTLSRLACRLYDPTAGVVCLDGCDIRHMRLSALRSRVGIVTQDVRIFSATVRDNAALFDGAISDAQIARAMEEVGLGTWLARLPTGLDTELNGPGSMSGGEAQLLAFARVFLRDPVLVILDEATSRLDPTMDALIDRATDRLLRESARRTAIVIAHKLSTVRRADRILVLDDGQIVESGARETLETDPSSRFARLLATSAGSGLP